MRTYQKIHLTARAEWRTLVSACIGPDIGRPASSECPAVPCSPGRARRLYPYLSGRRRRRQ